MPSSELPTTNESYNKDNSRSESRKRGKTTNEVVQEEDYVETVRKKSNRIKAFRSVVGGVAGIVLASALGVAIPTHGFGLFDKNKNKDRITPLPAPVSIAQAPSGDELLEELLGIKKEESSNAELDESARSEFIEEGFITFANGDSIQCYRYRGGYNLKNDPYYTKFDHRYDGFYENDDAYGYYIDGDTNAEKISNWLKIFRLSPEQIVRVRVQTGQEKLNLEEENIRANEIRNLPSDEYDKIANDTADVLYDKLKGGSIIENPDWVLENNMKDEQPGDHSNPELHGRLNHDTEQGEGKDCLLTLLDKNGNNIISDKQGFLNTAKDAGLTEREINEIDSTAYLDMDEGGTWKHKAGKKPAPASTPTQSPTTSPTAEPTPTPTQSPTPSPTAEPTPTPTQSPTPTPTSPGKQGDPHGDDLVDPSGPVNPNSETSQEENNQTNEGNQGTTSETPGSASTPNEGESFAPVSAPGADTSGERLPGGEDQSNGNMAGAENSTGTNTTGDKDQTGNNRQTESRESGNKTGGDNNSDQSEVSRVESGDF